MVVQPTPNHPQGSIVRFTWVLAQGDTGGEITWLTYADRSVQVFGTFGGASVVIEGSNDGTNWAVLTDPQGNDLSISSAKIEQILEVCLFLRPRISGGDGTTSLTAVVVARDNR